MPRITIVQISKPVRHDINAELQWLGDSLGLFSLRDKDKSCFRMFVELIKSAKSGTPLSSDELGERLHLTRGTVVHHLNRLMESGIVVSDKRRYVLRVEKLSSLVEEMEKDLERTYKNLKEIAEDIDRWMGL